MKYIVLLFIFISVSFGLSEYSQAQKIKKLYPLGKKIHSFVCKELSKDQFDNIDALYNYIDTHCDLKEKRYKEALSYYLWDNFKSKRTSLHFSYTKKTKCPVCGMFIYKFPAWATMMIQGKKRYFFDGVKDMMKFYFEQKEHSDIHLYVKDYYTKEIFDFSKGYGVIGSDIYGPMGDEIIPFLSKEDAEDFLMDHQAKEILPFSKITKKIVWSLDE